MINRNNIETPFGFYLTYFELLPYFKTQIATFEYLNTQVGYITGKKPYYCFNCWKNKV